MCRGAILPSRGIMLRAAYDIEIVMERLVCICVVCAMGEVDAVL
jgi:hypothetical protein